MESSLHSLLSAWEKWTGLPLETTVTILLILATLGLLKWTRSDVRMKRKEKELARRRRLELLRIIKVKHFDPGDIVGAFAAGGFTGYLPTPQDSRIAHALEAGDSVIISGRPGIGKTHAAAHYISKYRKSLLLLPAKEALDAPDLLLDLKYLRRRRCVLLLDDLHEYMLGLEGGASVIDFVSRLRPHVKELKVVATMRSTVPELMAISSDPKVLGRWKMFELEDWSRQRGEQLADRTGGDLAFWDGTPLSVKQPSPEMERRYRIAPAEQQAVLRALKFLRSFGVKPCPRIILLRVYSWTSFGGQEEGFEAALSTVRATGFLKKRTDLVEAYDPYLDAITDWSEEPTAYASLRNLLVDERRTDELLNVGAMWYGKESFDEAEDVYRLCVDLAPEVERCHYRLGLVLARKGEWSGAVESFRSATEVAPTFASAWYRLANALNKLGRTQDAKSAFLNARAASTGEDAVADCYRAEALRLSNHAEEALAELDSLLESHPGLALGHSFRGRVLLDLDRAEDAVSAYREAIGIDATVAEAHLGLAIAFRAAGDNAGAETAFREAILLDPNNVSAHSYLGSLIGKAGRSEEALAEFHRAIELDPNSVEAQFGLGMTLRTTGDAAGAEAAFREAIRLDPSHALALSYLGSLLVEMGRSEDALAEFHRAIELDPNSVEAQFGLGMTFRAAGDATGAEAAFRETIRLDPNNALAHSYLGGLIAKAGRREDALAEFRRAIELDPNSAEAQFGLGMTLRAAGDNAGAETAFRETIRLDPNHVSAHTHLGSLIGKAGRSEEALAEFHRAIELDPNSAEAHFGLGMTLRAAGDATGAEAAFREAIRLDPSHALAHSYLGGLLGRAGRSEDALAEFHHAIELDPNSAEAQFGLGLTLRAAGDATGAEAAFREAIRLDPNNALAHSYLGGLIAKAGRREDALEEFHRAIELDPNSAEAHFGLGLTLRAVGDDAGAKAAFQETIRLSPDHRGARSQLRRLSKNAERT